ncbi:MAG: hypothetical protein A3C43_05055 [Candidatus Schekmanbacteria bacterium RIFCSPHIGHO2_02_FULL_38_11]|uniref:Uncharacterized protein n=1 Tax=Candidatus Schekmanbacteria bacterium RIFCSPLOWO2_12_FULL_38_15 TaxID=1817883 RepID=A0A1F7SCF1_9BACT|nr:MAG: hypothetical protein A2043_03480 [Candidatus Schekmanbacteria bacterium GWA2_38_9]OGL51460.1 MAG: hypothetical protein A3G31_06310 [Candidatus Schekmanbacteria bacterium RIFCSPLOWO2_12_FULL_38_15]OGL51534.1 MAG: hypothetical protein A3H37_09260 [Candidatus Schekmanbacteria bacterium RIFCSPLOWO2_02_FULL_38_14]OGL53158.1 MAG: hypothetical protein A3C43_05055 [Candidatus Schekmanbacteria bacterium RIFCSPHIGHO2_02_FULL_38_11]
MVNFKSQIPNKYQTKALHSQASCPTMSLREAKRRSNLALKLTAISLQLKLRLPRSLWSLAMTEKELSNSLQATGNVLTM